MRRAEGSPYLEVLEGMHREILPNWYFEIGTQTGRSLSLSKSKSVAVGPEFRLKEDVFGAKDQLHLLQKTSDEFFASGFLRNTGITLDLAFLDGMRLYEFLLRDFINTERFMAPGSRIVMHDCMPWNSNMANRERKSVKSRAWTGDVWKIVPILNKYRPDLKVTLYDASPTGLVVVENLDPANETLQENYDEIRSAFDKKSNCEATVNGFKITSTVHCPWVKKNRGLNFAIKLPVPRPRVQRRWGDFYFGVGLMSAFQRAGHRARVQTVKHWDLVETSDEIDIVLKGGMNYKPVSGRKTVFWLISKTDLTEEEATEGNHFFVAGKPALAEVSSRVGPSRASLLPQAFDPARMGPPDVVADRGSPVFVGIARGGRRQMVRFALETNNSIRVWGNGWKGTDAHDFVVGERVANEELSELYRSASVVLNDHTHAMRSAGIPSNRIFDALACATPVITDDVGWFPEDMDPYIYVVHDEAEFSQAILAAQSESMDRRLDRITFAHEMREKHSFDTRAAEIIEKVTAT